MKKIWRSLTFNLSQALYPLIPDLYDIYMDLAKNEYISAKEIKQLSQNMYIIISACMLFALGIKLVSAIVNPDLLDDKKKGAKQTLFRSITAVFLIVLIPMGFEKIYTWQDYMLEEHIVEKVVLGMDTTDAANPGQVLAAYGFASFCEPNSEVSVESVSNSGGNYYNKAISEDINYIDFLDDAITSKTDGKWDLNYHSILSPAVGFFLVYEMVIICMDIALRSIKLTLLQLLVPIILSAYVIVGNDILQKWAKEVFSTFILVFVKIGMITFMIFGLSQLPGFLESITKDKDLSGRFFYTGILRLFMIIGLLQLVKQLPEILNKILGTNIKSRGGIRGRLGEMAGVGQMAQNAWDKVRAGAGTVAKAAGLGLGAVGALTSPLGWAAAGALGAGGALRHQWRKGFGNSTAWKDTKAGRGLRRVGAGAKAVGTGLNTKGGIFKAIDAGVKSYNDSEIGKQAQTEALQRQQDRRAAAFRKGVNNANVSGNIFDDNGNLVGRAMDGRNAILNAIENDSTLTRKQKDNAKKFFAENAKLTTLNELKSQKEKILSEIQNSQNSLDKTDPNYTARYNQLEKLKDNITNGKATASQIDQSIGKLLSDGVITEFAANNMGTSLGKIMNAIDSSTLSNDLKTKMFGADGNGNLDLSNKVLLSAITDQNTVIAGAKADYEQSKEGATAISKENLGRYERASDTINNKAMFEEQGVARKDADGKDIVYKYTAPSTTSQPSNNINNNGGTNNNPGNNGSGSQNINDANINGATVNVNNLNAQNVNAQNVNGNLNANNVDTSQLTGNANNVDEGTINAIADAVREGMNQADINAVVNNISQTTNENWSNQNSDDTYRNGGFNTNQASTDDDHDEFDQFYDEDE